MTERADPVAALLERFAAAAGVAVEPASSVESIWATLAESGIRAPGLAFSSWLATSVVGGVLLPAMANSPDVEGALARLARYHPLFGADLLSYRDGEISLLGRSGGPAHPETVDACFGLIARVLKQNERTRYTVELRRARPSDIDSHLAVLGAVSFGRPEDRFVVSRQSLTQPIPHADEGMLAFIDGYAERQVAMLSRTWSARVAERVQLDAPPSVAAVARQLLVSSRALQAHLRAEGTSYSELVDALRRDRALGLLGNSDWPVSAIATQLGFLSAGAFSRAVRRWTGDSPSGYRRGRFPSPDPGEAVVTPPE